VAAYVHVAGTNVTNLSGGTLIHPGSNGANGQGIGATAGSGFPNAQYALTLSLSAAGGFASTCQLTTTTVDVGNNAYTEVGSPTYHSYGDPANKAGSPPSWYNPSNFAGYDPNVASVSSSGLITARHVGSCIVEVAFPTFDNTLGTDAQAQDEPNMLIYAQVNVTVIA
jgi:hypothetical protein